MRQGVGKAGQDPERAARQRDIKQNFKADEQQRSRFAGRRVVKKQDTKDRRGEASVA